MTQKPTLSPPTWHKHPTSGLPLYGIHLPAGAVLEELDHYDSSEGYWKLCPALGVVLGPAAARNGIWVRAVAPLTNDEVIVIRDALLAIAEPTVSQQNLLRDCDITLGVVRARPETRLQACARVWRETRSLAVNTPFIGSTP